MTKRFTEPVKEELTLAPYQETTLEDDGFI